MNWLTALLQAIAALFGRNTAEDVGPAAGMPPTGTIDAPIPPLPPPLAPNPQAGLIFDTAQDTTAKLAQIKAAGFRTIIRYITTNTSSEKCVMPTEAKAIAAAGLRLGLVWEVWGGVDGFAHNDINTTTGQEHGDFAARWASSIGAPPSAVIYFAIDTDATDTQIASLVAPYFAAVKKAIAGRYRVGVYGSGAVCKAVLGTTAEKAWLSNATSWNGSKAFLASGKAVLIQKLPKAIAGLDTDPDDEISIGIDIGDFVPFAPLVA